MYTYISRYKSLYVCMYLCTCNRKVRWNPVTARAGGCGSAATTATTVRRRPGYLNLLGPRGRVLIWILRCSLSLSARFSPRFSDTSRQPAHTVHDRLERPPPSPKPSLTNTRETPWVEDRGSSSTTFPSDGTFIDRLKCRSIIKRNKKKTIPKKGSEIKKGIKNNLSDFFIHRYLYCI